MLLMLLSAGKVSAQTVSCGPIYCEGEEVTIDARDFVGFGNCLSYSGRDDRPTRSEGQGRRWIDRIKNMPDYLLDFYQEYGEKVQEVLDGNNNWASDPGKGVYDESQNRYTVKVKDFEGSLSFEFPKDATKELIAEYASQAAKVPIMKNWNEANAFTFFLTYCMSKDFPQAFWLRNAFRWGDYWNYRYNYNTTTGTGTITFTQTFYFTLKASDFDRRIDGFESPTTIASAVEEYKQKVNEVISNCPSGNRYDQIVYLNDWLTKHNSYCSIYKTDRDKVSAIVWSPMSALRETTGANGPVCEAYARAFKVFCDEVGIPCVLVEGFAKGSPTATGESHMWNEVEMEDGLWYAVDVTWNDPIDSKNRKISGMETRKWLLLGSQDEVSNGFTFAESHPIGITWDLDPNLEKMWDYSIQSFITTHKYSGGSAIMAIDDDTPASDMQVYDLHGHLLGNCRTRAEAERFLKVSPVIIVNGKKLLRH